MVIFCEMLCCWPFSMTVIAKKSQHGSLTQIRDFQQIPSTNMFGSIINLNICLSQTLT